MNAIQVPVKMVENVLTFTSASDANVPVDTKETPANLVGKATPHSWYVLKWKPEK